MEKLLLLLKITQLHIDQFYLAMKDHWTSDDYQEDSKYTRQLRLAEDEYKTKYGNLPEWEYHDDVVKARDDYKHQIEELKNAEKTEKKNIKIGITERGDPSVDMSWKNKIDSMDGTIIITKNLNDALINALFPYYDKVIVHVTCTGYGGTVVEPNIPPYQKQIEKAVELVKKGLPKDRIVIRIDPIIPTMKGLKLAKKVFELAYSNGFNRFRVSLIDMYPHVRTRFREHNLPMPYGKDVFSPPKEYVDNANKLFTELKTLHPDIVIESCAENSLSSTEKIGCISKKDLQLLSIPVENADTVGYQRKGCLCCSAKTELLSEKKQCPYKCLYCYWKNN